MKFLFFMAAFTLMFWGFWFPFNATAHSLEVVEASLQAKEPNARFVNRAAPSFSLEDGSGARWELSDLSDKVLIVNFANVRCEQECASHMTLIAELQQMVETAKMNEQVQFITVAADNGVDAEFGAQSKAIAKRFNLHPGNWVYVHGGTEAPDAGIRLAEEYGLSLTNQSGTPELEVVTQIIDRTGQLRARFDGLEFPLVYLISYANALVYDDHRDQQVRPSTETKPSHSNADTKFPLVSVAVLLIGFLAVLWYLRGRKSRT